MFLKQVFPLFFKDEDDSGGCAVFFKYSCGSIFTNLNAGHVFPLFFRLEKQPVLHITLVLSMFKLELTQSLPSLI